MTHEENGNDKTLLEHIPVDLLRQPNAVLNTSDRGCLFDHFIKFSMVGIQDEEIIRTKVDAKNKARISRWERNEPEPKIKTFACKSVLLHL